MKKAEILIAQASVSDYELINFPMDSIKERVKRDLARTLADELLKKIEITEEPDFITRTKRFRAEIVVTDREEHNRLNRLRNAVDEFSQLTKEVLSY